MKVKVTDACIGCGACAAIAPDIFEIDMDEMKSHVVKQPENEAEQKLARDAAEKCPVNAIKIK